MRSPSENTIKLTDQFLSVNVINRKNESGEDQAYHGRKEGSQEIHCGFRVSVEVARRESEHILVLQVGIYFRKQGSKVPEQRGKLVKFC